MWVLGAWEKPLLCPLLLSIPILTPDGMAEMSSGVLMTTTCPPTSISLWIHFLSQPGCVPNPLSLFSARC